MTCLYQRSLGQRHWSRDRCSRPFILLELYFQLIHDPLLAYRTGITLINNIVQVERLLFSVLTIRLTTLRHIVNPGELTSIRSDILNIKTRQNGLPTTIPTTAVLPYLWVL